MWHDFAGPHGDRGIDMTVCWSLSSRGIWHSYVTVSVGHCWERTWVTVSVGHCWDRGLRWLYLLVIVETEDLGDCICWSLLIQRTWLRWLLVIVDELEGDDVTICWSLLRRRSWYIWLFSVETKESLSLYLLFTSGRVGAFNLQQKCNWCNLQCLSLQEPPTPSPSFKLLKHVVSLANFTFYCLLLGGFQ